MPGNHRWRGRLVPELVESENRESQKEKVKGEEGKRVPVMGKVDNRYIGVVNPMLNTLYSLTREAVQNATWPQDRLRLPTQFEDLITASSTC